MSEPQPYDNADELVDIWQELRRHGGLAPFYDLGRSLHDLARALDNLTTTVTAAYTRNMSETEHRPTPTGRTQ